MPFNIETILKELPPWFAESQCPYDIVMGTMVRITRNIKGHPFPGWCPKEERRELGNSIAGTILQLPGFKTGAQHAEMSYFTHEERLLLLERRQITPCMAARGTGCHVIINKAQDAVFMVNEEEHVVLQCYAAGNKPGSLRRSANKRIEALGKKLDFAFSEKYGYLTSMASECGDGIQFYALLHLPGHVMHGEIDSLGRAMEKLRLNISPFFNEMGDETGNLYVMYSTPGPQGSEEDIAMHFENVLQILIENERALSTKSIVEDSVELSDKLGRAYGILKCAFKLSYREMLPLLSYLRFGVRWGYFRGRSKKEEEMIIQQLPAVYILAAPAYMRHLGDDFPAEQRQMIRENMIRRYPERLSLPPNPYDSAAY